MTDTPRTTDGAKLCAWCGGPIRQSGVGRSRDYCGRTCRELAYRERATQKRIAQALADASPVSSTDDSRASRIPSVDVSERPPLPPIPAAPIREPSPDLDARLDALADPDPVQPVRRPALPLPPPGPRGKRLFPPPPGRARPEPPTLWEDDQPPAG